LGGAKMDSQNTDPDTLAMIALRDPAATAEPVSSSDAARPRTDETGSNSLTDTGIMRAMRSGRVPRLDDLRRLSEQIRSERQVREAQARKRLFNFR
jgi:hypothetical protein